MGGFFKNTGTDFTRVHNNLSEIATLLDGECYPVCRGASSKLHLYVPRMRVEKRPDEFKIRIYSEAEPDLRYEIDFSSMFSMNMLDNCLAEVLETSTDVVPKLVLKEIHNMMDYPDGTYIALELTGHAYKDPSHVFLTTKPIVESRTMKLYSIKHEVQRAINSINKHYTKKANKSIDEEVNALIEKIKQV